MAGPEQSRPRAKARAAEIDAARRRAGLMLPAGLADHAALLQRHLAEWALAEVASGRLLPWMAVAYGFGIVAYFTVDREPAWWAAAALALAGIFIAFASRWRAFVFAMALGFVWDALSTPGVQAALQTVITAAAVFLSPPNSAT